MRRVLPLVCCLAGLMSPTVCVSAETVGNPKTGKKFQEAIDQPLSATWSNVNFRSILQRIGDERQVSILLDRRLDPSRDMSIELAADSLGAALDRLSADQKGRTTVVSQTLYIAPEDAAAKLRTLIALRQEELLTGPHKVSDGRQFELSKSMLLQWDDLDQPRELVRQICRRYKLELVGEDQIVPHDLWSGAIVPQVSAAEALSLVLIQFDLTFGWTAGAKGIRIGPVPSQVGIERSHAPPKGQTAAVAAEQWTRALPGIKTQVERTQVLVTGTVEDHEKIESLQKAKPVSVAKKNPNQAVAKQLSRVRFTLRIKDAPVLELLKKLEKAPDAMLTFEFDAEKLQAAGVDLNQRVSFEVKNATIEQLLSAALDPVGLTFVLKERTVHLQVK